MYRSEEEIKKDMLKNIQNTVDKTQNSLVHDALSAAAIEFVNMYMELDYLKSQFDVNNLQDSELERFINQRTGIERKPATYATTDIIISGEEGTRVTKLSLVSSGDINFEILDDVVIPASGSVSVKVQATEKGSIGNVAEDAINKMPVTIPGVIDIYNPNSVTNGYDAETDDELRERYYHKIQRPGKAGNKYHYEEWVMEVDGVGGVKAFPLWNGPLTIKVLIIDKDKQPADNELIEKTAKHIKGEAPFGADVTVESANGVDINISAELVIEDGYDEETAVENIREKVSNYLKKIAFWQSTVSYAIIGSLIIDTNGVVDYSNLRINDGTENIIIGDEEVAVLGGVKNE